MRSKLIQAALLLIAGAFLGSCSDSGAPSGPASPGYAFQALCVDVYTGEPIESLAVTLSTGRRFEYTTDADGRFIHPEGLDGGVTFVEIAGDAPGAPYHAVSQALLLRGDSLHVFRMIPVEPVGTTWVPNLLSLLNRMGKFSSGEYGSRFLSKWRARPVKCYIPPFVNPHGVDYAEQSRLAANRWMERTVEPLFEFVDSPPDTGISIRYRSRSEMGINLGFTTYTMDDDGLPVRSEISVVDDLPAVSIVRIIMLHELGHTIILGHADDPAFLMFYGQPLPDDITEDEARVVRLHEALPNRIDISIYDEDGPVRR